MGNQVIKSALLFLLILLAGIQVLLLAGYGIISLSTALPHTRSQAAYDGGRTGDLTSAVAAGSGGGEIWLTSCGTEDLGAVVASVRATVVYITGRRVTSSTSLPSKGAISFAPGLLTGDKMGSGIIFDPEGYILTNYHVIADTTDIRVSIFGDREKVYPAEIIALDPGLDLAVIKITPPFPLPTVTLGNSDMLEVADEVLAVGCPFNLEQSVTHGIVSDVKRTVTIDGRAYTDLIQTDASINSGNSGGALINMNGEVIGINVAIYAPDRVYCGVGFAIPINHAKLLLIKIQYLKTG